MDNDRVLIPMEQGMELLNQYANSLNVVICSQINGFLDPKILRQALNLVQHHHPRLNSHLTKSSGDIVFKTEGTEIIPLNILCNADPEYWKMVFISELNHKIQSHKVLLRANLIQLDKSSAVNYLITTIHHAIIDTMCGFYLHSEILCFYQKLSSKENINIDVLPVYQSLEQAVSNSCVQDNVIPGNTKTVDTLPFEQYVPYEQRKTRVIHRQLDLEISQLLIRNCKEKMTTVHGAICSAMMLALADYMKQQNKDFYFSCRSSVDMRRRLKPPISHENIAMLVSALTSFHTVTSETLFWNLAKQITEQIQDRLKTQEIYNVISSYRQGAEFLLNHPHKTLFSIFVTNIGNVKINSDYGLLKLQQISYGLSLTVMGSVFAVAVSTFQQKITFNFIYSEPILSESTVGTLADLTLSILNLKNN